MQTYTYSPAKGKLAGRRFEVKVDGLVHRPNIIDYIDPAKPDDISRVLYERDLNCYYTSLYVHNSIVITELPNGKGEEKIRITPKKTDPLHTFEKICKKFVVNQVQKDPNNTQVSLASLLDSSSKTF